MQQLITASGKIFQVIWCSISTIDYALRFEIKDATMQDVLSVFMDSAETEMLTYVFDEKTTEYNGYTMFTGVDMRKNGHIVVTLEEAT